MKIKPDYLRNRIYTSIYTYYNDLNHLQWIENVLGVNFNYHIEKLIEYDMKRKNRDKTNLVNYIALNKVKCPSRYKVASGRNGTKKTIYLTKLHYLYLNNVCFEEKTNRSLYISSLIQEDTKYRKGEEYTRDFYKHLVG
jgi:hypothetical protein